ncbi:hypothetical protein TWF481_010393 [Arthrobotrys musiformis]|uniref:Uncharacterized protein n=1 Tax=Arthrobotrys musiformis TaxID=47236 RepID=A0AAV9W0P7_9PEZI
MAKNKPAEQNCNISSLEPEPTPDSKSESHGTFELEMKQPSLRASCKQRQAGDELEPRSHVPECSSVRVTRSSTSLAQGKGGTPARSTKKSTTRKAKKTEGWGIFDAPKDDANIYREHEVTSIRDRLETLGAEVQSLGSEFKSMRRELADVVKDGKDASKECERKVNDDWNVKWEEREAQFNNILRRAVRPRPKTVGFPLWLVVLLGLAILGMAVMTLVFYVEKNLCQSHLEFIQRHWSTPGESFAAAFGLRGKSGTKTRQIS